MEHVDTVIVGAGVVGLAIARALAQSGREVLVLEAESAPGTVTSARNSGVVHAGLYYRPQSLKALCCVAGRKKLAAYVLERGIPYKNCGKLVVATDDEQVPKLREWQENAAHNNVEGVRLISAAEAQEYEPAVACRAALHVPVSGIIDVHAYLHSLVGDIEEAHGIIALNSIARRGEITPEGFVLDIGGAAEMQICCATLINAAGLCAQNLARSLRGLDPATIPAQVLAKGNYFSLSGKPPFSMLVYPLPVLGSSGLHAFCDMGGQMRFGPDVEWVDHIDYSVDPARLPAFEEAVRRYWPGLPAGALHPDYCGIRPKIARASPHDSDFILQGLRQHRISNLINLYGIESPGLTASLALGDWVKNLVETNDD